MKEGMLNKRVILALLVAMFAMLLPGTLFAAGSGDGTTAAAPGPVGQVVVAVQLPGEWSPSRYDTMQLVLRPENGIGERRYVTVRPDTEYFVVTGVPVGE